MKSILNDVTKSFLLKEEYSPNAKTYFQALSDLIEQIRPNTKRDTHRLQLVKEQVSKLRQHFRRLEEKVTNLEEQLEVLQEKNRSK